MSGRHRKPHNRAPGRHRRPPGPAHWIAPGLVVVALLGAGGVGAHAALSSSDGESQPQMPAAAPASVTTPSAASTPSAAPSASPSPRTTPQSAHHPAAFLQLSVTGSVSWIDVRRPSGQVLVSGMVHHGQRLTYRHGPLAVVIGNAGAVQISRHGHTTRSGKPGEVLRFTVR